MRTMQGEFVLTLPYKDINIHNFWLSCKCEFITIKPKGDGKLEFIMKPKCIKHILKYYEWKMASSNVPMKGLKVNYKWDEYTNGKSRTIK